MLWQNKDDNSCEQEAAALFGAMIKQALRPVFYSDYGVRDHFEGRFEVLVLHAFIIMHVNMREEGYEPLNQALFDVLFAHMDQALREMGKGDMGLPKQMRLMMRGFNGRVHRYAEALDDDQGLEEALIRNLYDNQEQHCASDMAAYIRDNIAAIEARGVDHLRGGAVAFTQVF